ncbi:MAG: beta-galactosidase [Abditibacteriota bacterium]|nr:beta-galactosidase [Abditibacteriota bacterium]
MRYVFAMLLILTLSAGALLAAGRPTTLRTRDNSPLCGFYFFTHWWEPWRSDDARALGDLREIRAMGCNVIFLDSEWSQMIDRDWFWLDRGHRLAKEAGLEILPWLSLKEWIDLGGENRVALVKKMYGVDLRTGVDYDGKPNRIIPYDEATIEAGYRYCVDYLDRYLSDGAILRVRDGSKLKPVVAITVELEWSGSNDEETNKRFRKYLKDIYSYTDRLNKAWGTRLGSIDEVELMDPKLFNIEDCSAGKAKLDRATEDQIAFRAKVQNDAMAEIKRRLKIRYPDLLIATELPHEMFTDHPAELYYRINGAATPETTLHADITVLRCTGLLSKKTEDALIKWQKDTGQHLVITYRTYKGKEQAVLKGSDTDYFRIGDQAARIGDGFGFYSWNEMVDTHIAAEPDLSNPIGKFEIFTPEESRAWKGLASQQIKEYLEKAK